jgi:hypothetical protein
VAYCCGARVRSWHTFPIRFAGAIASGYRVTFPCLAGELLDPKLPSSAS